MANHVNASAGTGMEKENGPATTDYAQTRRPYDYGGNPLAHVNTGDSARLPAFGGEFQPGLYRETKHRKFANPAPLGLCGFALTTFVLSLINLGTRGITEPNIVIGAAFAYGGICQLLAGMWYVDLCPASLKYDILTSYQGNGRWQHLRCDRTVILRWLLDWHGHHFDSWWLRDHFHARGDLSEQLLLFIRLLSDGMSDLADKNTFHCASTDLGGQGWFIFTFLLLMCTLRSTVAFFMLFFTLDLAFLFLGIAYLLPEGGAPMPGCLKAGGVFGLLAAFLAW